MHVLWCPTCYSASKPQRFKDDCCQKSTPYFVIVYPCKNLRMAKYLSKFYQFILGTKSASLSFIYFDGALFSCIGDLKGGCQKTTAAFYKCLSSGGLMPHIYRSRTENIPKQSPTRHVLIYVRKWTCALIVCRLHRMRFVLNWYTPFQPTPTY